MCFQAFIQSIIFILKKSPAEIMKNILQRKHLAAVSKSRQGGARSGFLERRTAFTLAEHLKGHHHEGPVIA